MSCLRITAITALIALGPPFVVWIGVVLTTNPDEGANIGGGIIVLAVLLISAVSASVFVGWQIVRSMHKK